MIQKQKALLGEGEGNEVTLVNCDLVHRSIQEVFDYVEVIV